MIIPIDKERVLDEFKLKYVENRFYEEISKIYEEFENKRDLIKGRSLGTTWFLAHPGMRMRRLAFLALLFFTVILMSPFHGYSVVSSSITSLPFTLIVETLAAKRLTKILLSFTP